MYGPVRIGKDITQATEDARRKDRGTNFKFRDKEQILGLTVHRS
jgi:hypothetical protein